MHVMSYFTNEDEALHLAVSPDGRYFAPLNGGRPVLRGAVGTGRLRDPFIGVGPDGVFHLLATDGWTSPNIVHAASTDLLTSNPGFASPGSGGNGRGSVNGYKLNSGSPDLASGVLISNNGGKDYFGNAVSATAKPNRGAY